VAKEGVCAALARLKENHEMFAGWRPAAAVSAGVIVAKWRNNRGENIG